MSGVLCCHIVCSTAKQLQDDLIVHVLFAAVSEIAARLIVKTWAKKADHLKLPRMDHQGLVELFAERTADVLRSM